MFSWQNFVNERRKDKSTANLGIYILSSYVIFWKWRHIVIVMSNCYNPNTHYHGTIHSSDIHRPVSSWRFWVYYEEL